MGEVVYKALEGYFNALEKIGYLSYEQSKKLLVLMFYYDFVMKDYRGFLCEEDYLLIERALDCLYGSSCLIPYPDYVKMGKLHLGEITEMAQRIKNIENTEVVKVMNIDSEDSDVFVTSEE